MSSLNEEDGPETPRVCEACGGKTEDNYVCRWCRNGFQNSEQRSAWREFRTRMRKISSTYSLLEKLTREMINVLSRIDGEESVTIVREGSMALNKWLSSDPDTKERRDASIDIGIFQKKALVLIMRKKQGT